MRKIKLTESQIKMLQSIRPKRKLILTEEQFNRISQVEGISLADRVSNEFKKQGRGLGVKFESNNPLNESFTVDLLTFAQETLQLLKEILTDPSQAGLSPFWRELGISRGELFGFLSDLGLITAITVQGVKKYGVVRKNLVRNIKRLYNFIKTNKTQPETNIEEDGRLPAGTANDPDAPWNRDDKTTERTHVPINYKLVYKNNEMAILSRGDKLYFFYYASIDKKEFEMFSEIPVTSYGPDDYDYGDWDIDGEAIELYVNYNITHLTIGNGIDAYESGVDIVLIDNAVKNEILNTFGPDEQLSSVLSSIEEATMAAGSSGSFVGPLSLKLGDPQKVSEEGYVQLGDDIEMVEEGPAYNQEGYNFYIVNRVTKKIYGGNEYREDAIEYMQELLNAWPDKKLSVYAKKSLMGYGINPDDNNNWATKSDIEESTTTLSVGGNTIVTPMFGAANKDEHRFGKKPVYPKGQITQQGKDTEDDIKPISEDAFKSTQYPKGEFVKLDDCVKLNNNTKAQEGKCSQGAADNVVKGIKTNKSVVSKDAVYYEVAKKTGKTIEEVKTIIASKVKKGNL